MNLTSAGLGMLGLQWPHYKGWGPRDKWAILARAGQEAEWAARGLGGREKGQREVGARACGAAPGAASPSADAQQALALEGCPQAPFLGIIIRGKGP